MALKIEKKIINYEVKKPEVDPADDPGHIPEASDAGNVFQMAPLLERDEELEGSTYKIRTPLSEHSLYITINDVIVHGGTEREQRRPFEIFINSKNMDNFSWIVALTRVISAIFRKGGDVTFLVEELRSVFDPRGGYFKRGGKYMPSLVAEIGECIEKHLIKIGMIVREPTPEELREKRAKVQAKGITARAQCPKCGELAVARLDGCDTCLECGHSKCG